MTVYDVRFRALAERLINETFGTVATLRHKTCAYDVASGIVTDTVICEPVKISPPQPFEVRRESGVVEGRALETYLAAATTTRPSVDDEIAYRGATYTITAVQLIVSGDQNAAYRVRLRA